MQFNHVRKKIEHNMARPKQDISEVGFWRLLLISGTPIAGILNVKEPRGRRNEPELQYINHGDKYMMNKLLQKALVPTSYGLLLAVIWIPIGIIIYMNYLAGVITMKYILYFLLGLPLIAILIGLIWFRKKSGYSIFSVSFLVLTLLTTVLIPIIFE